MPMLTSEVSFKQFCWRMKIIYIVNYIYINTMRNILLNLEENDINITYGC